MSISRSELTRIQNHGKYARFICTNLHLHTPATPQDWNSRSNQTTRAEDITPERYFTELNKTSLDLVAITDHNTINWCEPLMKLATDARKKGTSKIHIFPGVEITTYEGPHIIAIFDEDTTLLSEIKKFLQKLELSGDGNPEERVSKGSRKPITIHELLDMITNPKLDGIIIAPHIQTEDGIWGAKDFRSRSDVLNNRKLQILSAPSGDIKRVVDGDKVRLLYKNMPSQEITNSFAFVNVSDCHRLEDFEENTTWIKMSEPSLEGIRQIIYEPELRVSHRSVISNKSVKYPNTFEFTIPEDINYPYIIGISVSGGLLDDQIFAFSPHQNSIIGKNYSGKSALLDLIRFALDELPTRDNEAYQKLVARLKGILTDGGQVCLYIRGKDEKIYGVTRTLSTTKKRNDWSIEGSSDVYSLIDDEFRRDTDLSVHEVFDLEIYGQGEVVRIKDNVVRQMTIVDSLANVENVLYDLKEEGTKDNLTVFGQLTSNSDEITRLEAQCDDLVEEVSGIANLQKEIKNLEALAKSSKLKMLGEWGDLENQIHTYTDTIEDLRKELNKIKRTYTPALKRKPKVKKKSKTGDVDAYSDRARDIFDKAINQLADAFVELDLTQVLDQLKNIEDACHNKAEDITKKLKSSLKGSADKAEIVERISEKKRKLNSLKTKETKLNDTQKNISSLEEKRELLCNELRNKWTNVRQARLKVVDLINCNSVENVRAELVESADRSVYRKNLESIADNLSSASNKISNKQGQLDLVAERIIPDRLIELLRSKDIGKLIELSGITENTARILMGMGKKDYHLLETTLLDDKFLIKFQKEGEDKFTPIDAGLSGGEQALALVSVAMIPKNLPLVIDQPEDELGSSLITSKLIEQIRGAKLRRQLIFVTHIANIPVLADSEQVIYMYHINQSERNFATPKYQGSLDKKNIIECLLELDGGKFAFRKRSERYSSFIDYDRK